MKVRNFAFAAWAIEEGTSYTISHGNLHLDVDTQTLDKLLKEYRKTTFATISNRVKKLNRLVAESANATLSCRTK
ncbi:MAG: hypothetical protein WBI40_04260 [Methylococcaceae bacterium]